MPKKGRGVRLTDVERGVLSALIERRGVKRILLALAKCVGDERVKTILADCAWRLGG